MKYNKKNPPNSQECYERTLEEVAQLVGGVTKQRIWQLERSALSKLAQCVVDDLMLPISADELCKMHDFTHAVKYALETK